MRFKLKHINRHRSSHHFKAIDDAPPVEWKVSNSLVEYPEALRYMQERAENIFTKTAREQIWLLEHPSLYTAGTSAKKKIF